MPLSLELAEVRDFLSYLQLKSLASRTIDGYRHRLRNLFDDLPPELNSLTEITAAHLRCYVADLQAGEYAPVTVYHAVQEVKRFFAYLVLAGHLQTDLARRLPLPQLGKRLPKALSLTEMEALLHAVRRDSQSVLRDRVLIELLYVGGFRISEVLSLTVADCDLGDGSIRVIGKGNDERRVYLKPPVVKRLREYIEKEKLSGLLFPGRRGQAAEWRTSSLTAERICASGRDYASGDATYAAAFDRGALFAGRRANQFRAEPVGAR